MDVSQRHRWDISVDGPHRPGRVLRRCYRLHQTMVRNALRIVRKLRQLFVTFISDSSNVSDRRVLRQSYPTGIPALRHVPLSV